MYIAITEEDRKLARIAMLQGHDTCPFTQYLKTGKRAECDCPNVVDGCKARIEAIAGMIARARLSACDPF